MKRLLFAVLLGMALPAAAQYPNRTVTMLTGYPAGGLVDIVARMVAENMKPRFPAGLVVVNRPGAAGGGGGGRAGGGGGGGGGRADARSARRLYHHSHAALGADDRAADQRSALQDARRLRPLHQPGGVLPAHRGAHRVEVQDDPGAALRREGQSRDATRRHAGRGRSEERRVGKE